MDGASEAAVTSLPKQAMLVRMSLAPAMPLGSVWDLPAKPPRETTQLFRAWLEVGQPQSSWHFPSLFLSPQQGMDQSYPRGSPMVDNSSKGRVQGTGTMEKQKPRPSREEQLDSHRGETKARDTGPGRN